MEAQAQERDQVLYACSAQEPKLLPKEKRKSSSAAVPNGGNKLKAQVQGIFDSYKRQQQ